SAHQTAPTRWCTARGGLVPFLWWVVRLTPTSGDVMHAVGTGRPGRFVVSRLAFLAVIAVLVGLLAGCDTTSVVLSGTVSASPSGSGAGGVSVTVYADDAETAVAETTT